MARKKRYDISPELADRIRAAQANKRRVDTVCARCGVALPHVLPTRRYCSPACRALASYYRRKESADG